MVWMYAPAPPFSISAQPPLVVMTLTFVPALSVVEALEVLASIRAHGGYDRAEIERRDVAFENGHSCGMVKREIVKTWRAGK